MTIEIMALLVGVYLVSILVVFFVTKKLGDKKIKQLNTLRAAVKIAKEKIKQAESDLQDINAKVQDSQP